MREALRARGGITPDPRHAHPFVNRFVRGEGGVVREIHHPGVAIRTGYTVIVIYHATKMRWHVEAISPEIALKEAQARENRHKLVKPILWQVVDPAKGVVWTEIGEGGR